ncbi:MAG: MmgE/PrpD family protein [Myxococcota bacterium]
MGQDSLTARLVTLIRGKPIDVNARERAALLVLDGIANAVAGRNSRPGRILQSWTAREVGGADRLSFLVGGLTHILEVDDLHRASVVHPGCVVIPAAYAVARREGRTGLEFLDAVLAGYEATCRVGSAVGPAHYRVWHNTASCGPFGSAMAASQLLELELAATVDALGNAGSQAFGLWEFMESTTMTKHLHAARAAEVGVTAADLASLGFTGPPRILEGRRGFFASLCPDADPERVLAAPDAPWQLQQTSIKPWMCCRHTHPAIDAALRLHDELQGVSVDRVVVGTYRAALDVCDKPDPTTEYEAKFSLQHAVAVALVDGRIDFHSFEPEARARAASLRARVAVEPNDAVEAAYPEAWGAVLRVTRADGEELAEERLAARGDPDAPLTKGEMVDKARTLMKHGGEPDPDALIAAVLAMSAGGPVPAIDFLRST